VTGVRKFTLGLKREKKRERERDRDRDREGEFTCEALANPYGDKDSL
jgi:hypothetical protein